MQEFAGCFEVLLNGDTLLPLTSVLTPEALAFSLTDASHYIAIPGSAIDAEMLEAGITQEYATMLESLPAELEAIGSGTKSFKEDIMLEYEDASRMAELLARKCGVSPTDTQLEIDGEMHDAVQYIINTTHRSIYQCYDSMLTCGDARLEAFYAAHLASYAMDGKQYSSFSEAAEDMEDANDAISLLYTLASDEDWHYVGSSTFTSSEDGAYQNVQLTALIRQDGVDVDLYSFSSNQEGDFSVGVKGTISGEASFSEAADLELYFRASPGALTTQEEQTAFYPFAVSGKLNTDAAGWSLDVECGEGMSEMNYRFTVEVAREQSADGSATCAWRIALPDQRAELCFDVNLSGQPYAPFFEGKQAKEHDLSETSAANTQLTIDALALAGDMATLSADESVQRFGELFQLLLRNFTPIVDLSAVNGYNDYDENYEYGGSFTPLVFSTIEEARAHYDGVIPELVLPEGFELDYANVLEGPYGYAQLFYSCDEEEIHLLFNAVEVPLTSRTYYRVAADGSLRQLRDELVCVTRYEDMHWVNVSFRTGKLEYSATIHNIDDMERIQAIIAGLCL